MRRSNRTGMSSSAISAAKLKRPSFTRDYTAYMEHVQISGFLKSSVFVIMMMISSFDIVKTSWNMWFFTRFIEYYWSDLFEWCNLRQQRSTRFIDGGLLTGSAYRRQPIYFICIRDDRTRGKQNSVSIYSFCYELIESWIYFSCLLQLVIARTATRCALKVIECEQGWINSSSICVYYNACMGSISRSLTRKLNTGSAA